MEEKSKGISLRKKKTVRPKISAPKQISGPVSTSASRSATQEEVPQALQVQNSASGLAVPRERPQVGGGKTSDLVKRRYSARYTSIPQDSVNGAPPVPTVPGFPAQYASQRPTPNSRQIDGPGEPKIQVDIQALKDPNLRPEQYVANLLADATEESIYRYQQDLRKIKNRTSTDLQHNVYQNRTQFIKISKEAEKLKGEMRTLRSLMSDLTGALGQATAGSGTSAITVAARKQANRSSVANLEALWNTHLQALWKRVEGSQKFLPAIPGRHIVYESSRWVELNAATWKARRRVHLILLNDHFLIASEKKRMDTSPQANDNNQKSSQSNVQLVAERCWPLQDVQMADISTRSDVGRGGEKQKISNAINVRVGSESLTFAINGSENVEKTALLVAFRKAVEDLRKTLNAETEGTEKLRDSLQYLATRDPAILKKTDLLGNLAETASKRSSLLIDVDGKQQTLRWVENEMDGLDIDIALQRFSEGVARVERLRRLARGIKGNSVAQEIVTFKVNERAAKLASILIRHLVKDHSSMTTTQQHVGWLVRLGFEDRAREEYLDARSAIIKKRTRQCIFEGSLNEYVYQISYIYFTIIRNTVSVYQSCFSAGMMSACIKWAKEHVDDFNIVLTRQLSSVDPDSPTWIECMERARYHASILAEVGLDFKNLIGKGVESDGEEEEMRHDGSVGLGLS